MTEDWEALKDAEDLAYFRAELAEVSPGNYPLEEKMRVLEDMREVSSEIENGMREDFARLDEVTQTMFLGRLGASGYRVIIAAEMLRRSRLRCCGVPRCAATR